MSLKEAALGPVAIECEHGYDVCPMCDGGADAVRLRNGNIVYKNLEAKNRLEAAARAERPYPTRTFSLSFKRMRQVNKIRCIATDGFNHPLAAWSEAEWGNATGGEGGEAIEPLLLALATMHRLGEAENLAKKLIRFRGADKVANNKDRSYDDYKKWLAHEIAGMVLYADLWAASLGIDLEQAVRDEFNAVSDKIGYPGKL